MEKADAAKIADSFVELFKFLPFGNIPLKKDSLERVLELTPVPIESSKVQYPINPELCEPVTKVKLNSQYDDATEGDFILHRVLANDFETDYKPGIIISGIRKHREEQFFKDELEFKREYVEVMGRLARNDPLIAPLMKRSLKLGNKYSAMGFLECVYRSEKQDHEFRVKIPIMGLPGIIRPLKREADREDPVKSERRNKQNEDFAKRILEFGINYQKPTSDMLKKDGYKLKYK